MEGGGEGKQKASRVAIVMLTRNESQGIEPMVSIPRRPLTPPDLKWILCSIQLTCLRDIVCVACVVVTGARVQPVF